MRGAGARVGAFVCVTVCVCVCAYANYLIVGGGAALWLYAINLVESSANYSKGPPPLCGLRQPRADRPSLGHVMRAACDSSGPKVLRRCSSQELHDHNQFILDNFHDDWTLGIDGWLSSELQLKRTMLRVSISHGSARTARGPATLAAVRRAASS